MKKWNWIDTICILSPFIILITACSESRNKYELERQKNIEQARVECFASGGTEFVIGRSGESDDEVCVYKTCASDCFILEEDI